MSKEEAGQADAGPSLRDSISSAFDAPAADAAPASVAPVADKPPDIKPADAKPVASQDGKPAAIDPAKPAVPAAAKPADPAAKPADPQAKAPAGFPGGDAAYAALPAEAREWTKARETQFAKGLQRNAEAAKFGGVMWGAVQPYEAMLRQQGVHPAQVVAEAMNMHFVMTQAPQAEKAAMLQRMAQKYGVELSAFGDGQAQAPQSDPRVDRLEMALRHVIGRSMQAEEQQVQAQFHAATQSVDEFARDPQHEHIRHPGVIDTMANLVETGAAQDLKHAYEMAIWTRPELRAVLLEKDAARRASEARAAADAATNRGGAPVAAVTKPNDDSLRGEIERAFGASERRAA